MFAVALVKAMSQFPRTFSALLGSTVLLTAPVLLAFPEPQGAASKCDVGINVNKVNSDTINKETRIGQAMAREVERVSRIIDDPATTQYLNNLAQNLARNSEASFPIQVKIIESDVKNELVLPGGFLYVNDGLILQAETEPELAGALAYGIAYGTLRCGEGHVVPDDPMQIGSMAAFIFEPYGWAGYRVYEGMNLAIPLTYLKEERKLVLAADRLGLSYLHQTGYDPRESVSLLERISLSLAKSKNESNALSAFPPLAVRLDCMRKEIAKVFPALETEAVLSSEFEKAKDRLSSRKRVGPESVPRPTLRQSPAPKS
jgi:beta-barrel assembly-enhancing protease